MMFNNIYQTQDDYFQWRVQKVKDLKKEYPEIFNVANKKVLEIGCGAEAPLSYYLSEFEKAEVFSGEVTEENVKDAKRFAPKAEISLFPSENIPFEEEEFEVVYLMDVLEHVQDAEKTLKEAKRVLQNNGLMFIEFSPYFAYPSGHHLYTLGIKGLLPFQLFPKQFTKGVIYKTRLKGKDSPEYLFNQFNTLNKMTISKANKLIKYINLKISKSNMYLITPQHKIKINFLKRIPLMREVIGMSYSCVLKKV